MSVALTLKNTGAPLELVQAAVMFDGQVMAGGWLSTTVTVKPHEGPAVVVQLTKVAPTGKNVPERGLQVTMPHEPLVTGAKVTMVPHWPGAVACVKFAGQVRVQSEPQVTVALKLHVVRLLLESVAEQLTVVVPGGN